MRHLALALALGLPLPASAQEIIAQYFAFIGPADVYNSEGQRLTNPAQIVRQDRANFHRFGIRDANDEWDPLFGDAAARAEMERLIAAGRMHPAFARFIVAGNAPVFVTVWGRAGWPEWIEVEVPG